MAGLLDAQGFAIDETRPKLQNPDGSFSTEETITVGFGDRYYNIPTIWGGQRVPHEAATLLAREAMQNGQVFPNFGTLDEALKAAKARSAEIGRKRKPHGLLPR